MFVLQPLGPELPVLVLRLERRRGRDVGRASTTTSTVFSDDELLNSIFNAFKLIFFFSVIPVSVGLVTASIIRGAARGRFGTVSRTVLFLPQVIPLVAAGIMWNWVLAKSGTVNQILTRRRARWDHPGVARGLRLGARRRRRSSGSGSSSGSSPCSCSPACPRSTPRSTRPLASTARARGASSVTSRCPACGTSSRSASR